VRERERERKTKTEHECMSARESGRMIKRNGTRRWGGEREEERKIACARARVQESGGGGEVQERECVYEKKISSIGLSFYIYMYTYI